MAELAVALDFSDLRPALEFCRKIQGRAPWVKVGLELFTAWGPDSVEAFKAIGFKVFLDLKLMDIPNTVQGAARAAARCGCDMLTVHTLGGDRMMRAALEGARLGSPGEPPLVVGVSVLTSMAPEDLPFAADASISDLAGGLSLRARDAGLDGVVCSPLEAARVKAECGRGFLCVTPGIRPAAAGDDQRRVATPAEAVKAGSDLLVVGRPLTEADSPLEILYTILGQME
jgi:orotidine-5'-phosphate decarboxylase